MLAQDGFKLFPRGAAAAIVYAVRVEDEDIPGMDERDFAHVGDSEFALAQIEREVLLAIGVICRPETERRSHYFWARVPDQFDAVIHIDETRAVEPLEPTAGWDQGEVPVTYQFAV